MRLFFHHVGQFGADRDFPKTVFAEVPITVVEDNIPPDNPHRDMVIKTLWALFPSGRFNCWGVPEGARYVIQHLSPGDFVLLVESVRIDGDIPALCQVEAFWPHEFPRLSAALWGESKFPYIFYFRTEPLDLPWIAFLDDVLYAPNFDPRGKFYSVSPGRLAQYGGEAGFVRHVRATYSSYKQPFELVTHADLQMETDDPEPVVPAETDRQLQRLQQSLAATPPLTEHLEPQFSQSLVRPRDAAFAVAIKRLYGYKCAMCGRALRSPDGKPEVQAAHLYPKRLDGSDDLRNGICLCRMHHWALDVGWMSLADNRSLIVRPDVPQRDEYLFIHGLEGALIGEPADQKAMPHPIYLTAHRKLMGFQTD